MSLRSGSRRSSRSCGGGATKAFPSRTISPTATVPNGRRAAHNAPSRHLAAEAGYEAAVAIRRRMNGDDTDLFALRRIPVTSETSVARFAWDLFRLSWFYGT